MSLELKDRVPTRPNRKLITPEGGGTPYFATIVYADEPVEIGTPINKATLESLLSSVGVSKRTYSELSELKKNNQLEIGKFYLLTDYVTKYKQPSSNKMKVGKYDLDTATQEQIQEETEPLLLTAISNNEFAVECYSSMFPDDIIYYDFDNNICEDKKTPRNGFILRRYFVKNEINVPNDWRHIKWARYEKDYGAAGVLLTYDSSGTYKGEYYTFDFNGAESSERCHDIEINATNLLCNTVWAFTSSGSMPHNIKFKNDCVSNTFRNDCHDIDFGSRCFLNTSGNGFRNNIFGSECNQNIFGDSCQDNTLESNCNQNIFGNGSRYLFVKRLQNKNISSISDLQYKNYTNTIEQMSNSNYCYWYKTGTNPTDVVTVQIP